MLPEGEYLYKDLSSEFVDLEKLLEEIDEEKVSGYMSFESDDERGFAVLDRGEVGRLKITRNGRERIEDGANAVRDVLQKDEYTVHVVDCNESGREIVDIKLQNEEIKSGIDTEDIEVPSFLATNITDQENDCHIILISDDYSGVVTMVDGIPTQAKLSTPDEILVGNDALEKALNYINSGEVSIDIYRMSEDEVEEQESGKQVIGEHMEDELEGISDDFEDKADDLLDDMGLGIGDEGDGEGDDGGLMGGEELDMDMDEDDIAEELGMDDDGDDGGDDEDELELDVEDDETDVFDEIESSRDE
ncbi:MAG: hypothetical protein ACLFSW_04235 [Halobacteriales archaeon]